MARRFNPFNTPRGTMARLLRRARGEDVAAVHEPLSRLNLAHGERSAEQAKPPHDQPSAEGSD